MTDYAMYICGDRIGEPGGAGQVTKHELAVLQRIYGPDNVVVLQLGDVRPDPYAYADVPYLWDYFALSKVARLCETQGPPRQVHFYSGCYSETVRYLVGKATKVSYTCPAHDIRISQKERGAAYWLPHIDIPELWAQHKLGYQLADLVIAPGEAPRDFLESEGVDPKKMVIIPHGIDRFPETVKPFPDVFRVGYLGAYGPDKGVRYLLRAWGELALPDAELWLAGAGSESMERLVRQCVPAGKVRLLGWVDSPADFYQELSVYVQVSCEGFGIEVPEALASGRPCIVSEAAGAADLVRQPWPKLGEQPVKYPQGLLCKFGDVPELVGALKCLHSYQDQLPAMGAKAREVARRLTWPDVEAKYEAIFYSKLGV